MAESHREEERLESPRGDRLPRERRERLDRVRQRRKGRGARRRSQHGKTAKNRGDLSPHARDNRKEAPRSQSALYGLKYLLTYAPMRLDA
jgi:hypothetical protein